MIKKKIEVREEKTFTSFRIKIPLEYGELFIKFKTAYENKLEMTYPPIGFSGKFLQIPPSENTKVISIEIIVNKDFVNELKGFIEDFWEKVDVVVEFDEQIEKWEAISERKIATIYKFIKGETRVRFQSGDEMLEATVTGFDADAAVMNPAKGLDTVILLELDDGSDKSEKKILLTKLFVLSSIPKS